MAIIDTSRGPVPDWPYRAGERCLSCGNEIDDLEGIVWKGVTGDLYLHFPCARTVIWGLIRDLGEAARRGLRGALPDEDEP